MYNKYYYKYADAVYRFMYGICMVLHAQFDIAGFITADRFTGMKVGYKTGWTFAQLGLTDMND